MNLIYSAVYVDRRGFLGGAVMLLDDWLKRDRFVLIGWSGLYYFPLLILVLEHGSLEPHLSQVG